MSIMRTGPLRSLGLFLGNLVTRWFFWGPSCIFGLLSLYDAMRPILPDSWPARLIVPWYGYVILLLIGWLASAFIAFHEVNREREHLAATLAPRLAIVTGEAEPFVSPSVDTSNPAKRGRRKPGHRGGHSSGCVVARSLRREQVAFSGDTTIAPTSEIVAL